MSDSGEKKYDASQKKLQDQPEKCAGVLNQIALDQPGRIAQITFQASVVQRQTNTLFFVTAQQGRCDIRL